MQFLQTLAVAVLAVLPLGILASPVPQGSKQGDVIPDNFIVVLKEDISAEDFAAHTNFVAELHGSSKTRRDLSGLKTTYEINTFKGYAGEFDQETIDQIATRTEVAFVEPDTVVKTQALTTQANVANWGLASISHKTSTSATNYIYDSTAGSGTFIYVIDTGILTTHTQFTGRVTWGANFVNSANTDENGHGTHVSGIAAGTTFGVAKSAHLIAVKVLDASGSGSNSGVISGIQFAQSDAVSNGRTTKSVANMSLGGSLSSALNSAVTSAIASGLTFAVAAGNDGANAANSSPASTPNALTVGAITQSDARASFSNFGAVVDIFAPGNAITSSYIGSNSATASLSGTSMASPHIAGLAAYLIGLNGFSTPAAVRAGMISLAQSRVTNAGSGTTTLLAYNGNGA